MNEMLMDYFLLIFNSVDRGVFFIFASLLNNQQMTCKRQLLKNSAFMTGYDKLFHKIMLTLFFFLILSFVFCSKEDEGVVTENGYNDEVQGWVTESLDTLNTRQVIFYSSSTECDVSFHIFLPDEYKENPTDEFPVIYWLHGSGGGTSGIVPLVTHFKSAMSNKKIPPVLVVFPNGLPHGMWCNSKDGRKPVESMFIDDLIPYIDSNYRTIKSRRGRVVEGFSMGGYGAGRFGFKYSNIFGGFSMFGAGPLQLDFSQVPPHNQDLQTLVFSDVYGNDMDYFEAQSPWRLAEIYGPGLPNITPKRIIVGRKDFVYPANVDFHNHLDSLGIPHQFRSFQNIGHNLIPLFNSLDESLWVLYNAVFVE